MRRLYAAMGVQRCTAAPSLGAGGRLHEEAGSQGGKLRIGEAAGTQVRFNVDRREQ